MESVFFSKSDIKTPVFLCGKNEQVKIFFPGEFSLNKLLINAMEFSLLTGHALHPDRLRQKNRDPRPERAARRGPR